MLKKIALLVIIILAILVIPHFITFKSDMILGVSFSDQYARYLGLDARSVYQTILNDWNFKYIRLSAQWNIIENNPDDYDFGELDWQMDEAAARGAKITLALGQKTPRWPECHTPTWAQNLSDQEYFAALSKFMEAVVNRYRHHTALETWQIENEAFLSFGANCRPYTPAKLDQEIALVRALDSDHPILITDSGELSSWRQTAAAGDLFGTTMYRVVWNKFLGYTNYDWLPPLFYRAKLFFNGRSAATAWVVELQAEPWIPDNNLFDTSLVEQYKSMNINRLTKNISFARSTGMARAYLWGAEWWVWLGSKGETAIPNFIQNLPK
ncbi:MAG: beta-galactosidase [Candidatus Magasanikbacteria bacterium]|jgi:hypothetical protein